MNATFASREEDDLGYEFAARRQNSPVSERIGQAAVKQLTGRERAAHQSRFARRTAPSRMSGIHRRSNKRHGF
jgi:hypothetical protein